MSLKPGEIVSYDEAKRRGLLFSSESHFKRLKEHLKKHTGASYPANDETRIAIEFVCDRMDELEDRLQRIEFGSLL